MSLHLLPGRPRVVSDLQVQSSSEGPLLVRRLTGFPSSFSLGPDSEVFVDRVLPLLDGASTVAEVIKKLEPEFDGQEIVEALDQLAEEGLIVEGDAPTEPVHALRCYRAMRSGELAWCAAAHAKYGGRHPNLLDRPQFVQYWRGWWSENLHFAANAAKKFALIGGRVPRYSHELLEFLVDEHDHVLIFRKGARTLGLDPDRIMRSAPLPEMVALNSFILQSAKRHPLSLGWIADRVERGTTAIMRNEDGSPASFRKFAMDRLSDHPDFLEHYFTHADIEQAASHGSYGREMFAESGPISAEDYATLLDLAETAEWMFARKNAAIMRAYGPGGTQPPRPATNALAALEKDAPAAVLGPAVRDASAQSVGRLGKRPSWKRLETPDGRASFARAWAALHREWSQGALESPSLAYGFDARYATTCLSVSLLSRSDALKELDAGKASLEARSLAAVVAEAAESSTMLALGQAAFLEALRVALQPHLAATMPEKGYGPLRGDLPDAPSSTPLEALACFGPVGPLQAQELGVHLQTLEELLEMLVDSI